MTKNKKTKYFTKEADDKKCANCSVGYMEEVLEEATEIKSRLNYTEVAGRKNNGVRHLCTSLP